MDDAERIRDAWGGAELRGLWDAAREALRTSAPTFRLQLPDEATRQAVGELYGRPMWGAGTRISVSKLDEALRASRVGVGLREALEALHGTPVDATETGTADTASPSAPDPARTALAAHDLLDEPWAEPWLRWIPQYGRIAAGELPALADRTARVLAAMSLRGPATSWTPRAELAARAGDPRGLDAGTALSRLALKAAALAHEVEPSGSAAAQDALWERSGVLPDAVSATALCWALPLTGTDPWSASVTARTRLGLPAHLTAADLRTAPQRLVEPGTPVAVVEHDRLLEAAAEAGTATAVLGLGGRPGPVARLLLTRLRADGAMLHVNADFDWPGVALTGLLHAEFGAQPWRMGADDYRSAVDAAAESRTDLPNLVGESRATPWDPHLAELMATSARAVRQEQLLDVLLADLAAGPGR
ncbi:DUF2399 domain-containing protein [Saccharopolyspora sp. HNM0983]|uniref:DUF2399 domain-containing protein n=1 Tax=Saccharopolyspora montiporae TaxID=2781240 RepID=A0A929BBJ4_9PSEU|nr:TIGR02679 domain-containing protein [Saccharopolyspora sp. HNM0983]MBE9374643.1 DUF2399 domain-containing protein [Saccharopolyspora sp. HNM0983]